MGGASRVGHWESGNTPGYVRAQRGRARSALFSRVTVSLTSEACCFANYFALFAFREGGDQKGLEIALIL